MIAHVCSIDECGWSCWLDNGQPTRDVSVHFDDCGDIDGEGPCGCEAHE